MSFSSGSPYRIRVYNDKLIWTDYYSSPKIRSANMDGTSITPIADNIDNYWGLDIDRQHGYVKRCCMSDDHHLEGIANQIVIGILLLHQKSFQGYYRGCHFPAS